MTINIGNLVDLSADGKHGQLEYTIGILAGVREPVYLCNCGAFHATRSLRAAFLEGRTEAEFCKGLK